MLVLSTWHIHKLSNCDCSTIAQHHNRPVPSVGSPYFSYPRMTPLRCCPHRPWSRARIIKALRIWPAQSRWRVRSRCQGHPQPPWWMFLSRDTNLSLTHRRTNPDISLPENDYAWPHFFSQVHNNRPVAMVDVHLSDIYGTPTFYILRLRRFWVCRAGSYTRGCQERPGIL